MKSGEYRDIEDFLEQKSAESVNSLLFNAIEDPRNIQNMLYAARTVVKAIRVQMPITIIGDYDSDGLNATAILTKLFRFYGVEPTTIIPKRMSEGYGLSEDIVSRIDGGLVITIDNGIAAVDEIGILKQKGCYVIIMDHHLPGETLPPADIIVDPHVSPEENGFVPYCGAGLGYQMARLILENDHSENAQLLLADLTVHAAIATITDVMPLVGTNREIVKEGIFIINNRPDEMQPGLTALCQAASHDLFDEETIGFKLGPMINAPARLYNAGGTSVLKALLSEDDEEARAFARKMVEINERRKKLVQEAMLIIDEQIEKHRLLFQGAPLCVYCPELQEGIIGIVAGKLQEKYHMPAFVFCNNEHEPETLKGSGRSPESFDLAPLLLEITPMTVKCGGHSGAAGITVKQDAYRSLVAAMHRFAETFECQDEDVVYYDIEITPEQVPEFYKSVKRYVPYGNTVPKPTFLVKGFSAISKFGNHYRVIGAEKDHFKLNGEAFDALCFGKATQYVEMGCPVKIDMICTLGENTYNGKTNLQVNVNDFRIAE